MTFDLMVIAIEAITDIYLLSFASNMLAMGVVYTLYGFLLIPFIHFFFFLSICMDNKNSRSFKAKAKMFQNFR